MKRSHVIAAKIASQPLENSHLQNVIAALKRPQTHCESAGNATIAGRHVFLSGTTHLARFQKEHANTGLQSFFALIVIKRVMGGNIIVDKFDQLLRCYLDPLPEIDGEAEEDRGITRNKQKSGKRSSRDQFHEGMDFIFKHGFNNEATWAGECLIFDTETLTGVETKSHIQM